MADLARYAMTFVGIVAIVPALLILVLALSRFDRQFKDETLFLMFMGGLVAGFLIALFEAFSVFLSPGGMALVGFPLVEQLAKTAILNRRKHQDERPIVFYGGAFGVGLGVMLVLVRGALDKGVQSLTDYVPGIFLIVVGASLLLLHFATGAIIGRGVIRKEPFKGAGLAVLLTAPLYVMIFEFDRSHVLLYLVLMMAYALGVFYWVADRVLPEGLSDDARRQLRRQVRREARGQTR